MKKQSAASLRKKRRQLVQRLTQLETVLRGSLIERYKPCGKPGCRCAEGPGHGPKYYLSISQSGARPQMHYVPQSYYEQVVSYLEHYRKVRQTLNEIASINLELLRRREPL